MAMIATTVEPSASGRLRRNAGEARRRAYATRAWPTLTGPELAPNLLCTAVCPLKKASARFRSYCPAAAPCPSSAIFHDRRRERPAVTFVERHGGSSKARCLFRNFHTWVAISHELPKGAPSPAGLAEDREIDRRARPQPPPHLDQPAGDRRRCADGRIVRQQRIV